MSLILTGDQVLHFKCIHAGDWRIAVRRNNQLTWSPGELVELNLWRTIGTINVFLVQRLTTEEKTLFFKENGVLLLPALFRQKIWKVIYEDQITFGVEALFTKLNEET